MTQLTKEQQGVRQRLYKDAVDNNMFTNGTVSYEEFNRRIDHVSDYVDKVADNYRNHGVDLGDGNSLRQSLGAPSARQIAVRATAQKIAQQQKRQQKEQQRVAKLRRQTELSPLLSGMEHTMQRASGNYTPSPQTKVPMRPQSYVQDVRSMWGPSEAEKEDYRIAGKSLAEDTADKRRRNQPLVEGASPYVAKTVGQYEDEQRRKLSEQLAGVSRDIVGSIVSEREQKAHAGDLDAEQAMLAGGQNGMNMVLTAQQAGRFNEVASPEALWEAVDTDDTRNSLAGAFIGGYDANGSPVYTDTVISGAKARGISPEDYIRYYGMPAVAENIAAAFESKMTDRYAVRDYADYLARKFSDSLIGTVADSSTTTRQQRQRQEQAVAETEQRLSGWERAGGTVANLLGQMPEMIGTGAIGGAAVKAGTKVVGRQIISRLSPRIGTLIANGGNTMLTAASENIARKLGRQAIRFGYGTANSMAGMSGFMSADAVRREISTGEDPSFASIAKAGWEGTKEGAETGVLFGVAGIPGRALTGAAGKVADTALRTAALTSARTFSVAAEAGVMTAQEYAGWLEQPHSEGEQFDLTGSIVNSLAMVATFKGQHLVQQYFPALGARVEAYNKANPDHKTSAAKMVCADFVNLFSGKTQKTPVAKVTGHDKSVIETATGKTIEQLGASAETLAEVFSNKRIPWNVRQKIALDTFNTMEVARPRTQSWGIASGEKGGYYLTEYDREGNPVEQHQFKSMDEHDAILGRIMARRDNNDMLSYIGMYRAGLSDHWDEMSEDQRKEDIFRRTVTAMGFDYDLMAQSSEYRDMVINDINDKTSITRKQFLKEQQKQIQQYPTRDREIVSQFAEQAAMKPDDVWKIIMKDPLDRTEDEQALMSRLSQTMHDDLFRRGELHRSQSMQDGADTAGQLDITDTQSVGAAYAEISKRVSETAKAWNDLCRSVPMLERINGFRDDKTTPEQFVDNIATSTLSDYDKRRAIEAFSDMNNAVAAQSGFKEQAYKNVATRVSLERKVFSAAGDSKVSDSQGNDLSGSLVSVTFGETSPDGTPVNYRIISSSGVRFREDGSVDAGSPHGMVVVVDDYGRVTSRPAGDPSLKLVGVESADDFTARRTQELSAAADRTFTQAETPREPAAGSEETPNKPNPANPAGPTEKPKEKAAVENINPAYKTAASLKGKEGQSLTEDESKALIDESVSRAPVATEMELTPENWREQFGEKGEVSTPIGYIKMGDGQYLKLAQEGRNGKLGMIKPTLESPDVIVEDERPAKDGKQERPYSYVFIKAFKGANGERVYYFTSVTVSKEGKEVVISNQEKSFNRISTLLTNGRIAWINDGSGLHPTSQNGEPVPDNGSRGLTQTGSQSAGLGVNPSTSIDTGKDTASFQIIDDGGVKKMKMPSGELVRVNSTGYPYYSEAKPQDAAAELLSRYRDKPGRIDRTVGNNISQYQKELDKAKKVKPSEAADQETFDREEDAREQAIKDAQQKLDHWNSIRQEVARARSAEAEAEKAEQERQLAHTALEGSYQQAKELGLNIAGVESLLGDPKATADTLDSMRHTVEWEIQKEQDRLSSLKGLEGVPFVDEDTPEDALRRGYRNDHGTRIDRPAETDGVYGKEATATFSYDDKNQKKGRLKVIEAESLQPSHIGGQRNLFYFISKAQPKNRTDAESIASEQTSARNIDPRLITGDGYQGVYAGSAPIVNTRGETIQGNHRGAILRTMYDSYHEAAEKYKQYLIDHASEFGIDPEEIRKMKHPAVVIEIDVPDAEAIRLGQLTARDLETGGIRNIDPDATATKLLNSKKWNFKNFLGVLLRTQDPDASIADLIVKNGPAVIKRMAETGVISNTEAVSAVDSRGSLTPEAKKALKDILLSKLFHGGAADLAEKFDNLPIKVQNAIATSFARDYKSPESERIIRDLQQAIDVLYRARLDPDFAAATTLDGARSILQRWLTERDMYTGKFNGEGLGSLSVELAARMQAGKQKEIAKMLDDIFDRVQASSRTGQLSFGEQPEPVPLREAVRQVLGIGYTRQVHFKDPQIQRETANQIVTNMQSKGISVSVVSGEGQQILDKGEQQWKAMTAKQKRALETVSPSIDGTGQQTVISSAAGAKILKALDNLVNDYENSKQTKEKTFIGNLAAALRAERHGSSSEYASFETKNGKIVTIRLGNHNAKVSTFDNHREQDGISIVISAKGNLYITNDGNAHVVEFYFDAIKLRRAEGKPLAQIVRDIKQTLYSGEFKDKTGLAERQEVNIPLQVRRMMERKKEQQKNHKAEQLAIINATNPMLDDYHTGIRSVDDIKTTSQQHSPQAINDAANNSRGIVVPKDEYAKISHQISTYQNKEGVRDVFTDNTVTPSLRAELAKRGVEIKRTDMVRKYEQAQRLVDKANYVNAETEETKDYPKRVQEWLNKENLDKARGKELKEVEEIFDNNPQPIAYVPEEYLYTLGRGITDNRIYSGMAYFIDHAANHHPSIDTEKYYNIQDVLSNPDHVKQTNIGIAFIKKIDRWNSVIVNVEKTPDGKIIWHKSFLDQKGEMYKNYPDLLKKKPSEDATPSINPAENAVGSKRKISTLDDSITKLANSSQTANEEQQKNHKAEQLAIINATNPMLDDYHTGIRSVDDIKTTSQQHSPQAIIDAANNSRGIVVPKDEYAKIAHQISTYQNKKGINDVFTDNNYYLCDVQDKDGNFRVIAELPIVGNEELINNLRNRNWQGHDRASRDIGNAIDQLRRTGASIDWNYVMPQGRRTGNEGLGNLDLRQPSDTGRTSRGSGLLHDFEKSSGLKFFRTKSGEVYGFVTRDGKMYLDPRHLDPSLPIHEYGHLWAEAVRQKDHRRWESIVKTVNEAAEGKLKPLFDEVRKDDPSLTADALAEEVLMRYSGKKGMKLLDDATREIWDSGKTTDEKQIAKTAIERVKDNLKNAIREFWRDVADMLGIKYRNVDDIADHIIHDALTAKNPREGEPKADKTDNQGNPVDPQGKLIKESVASVEDITDRDFTNPTRTIQLPVLPQNIDMAIGANGKPVIIKKNIFEKNAKAHQFEPAESRRILKEALYSTDLVGQTKPAKRPNHWVVIKVDDESPITVLEVNENKEDVEVVGWYRLDGRNLERIQRQAEREGGELLILTPKGAAASLSTLPHSSSEGKVTESSSKAQEKGGKNLDAKPITQPHYQWKAFVGKNGETFDITDDIARTADENWDAAKKYLDKNPIAKVADLQRNLKIGWKAANFIHDRYVRENKEKITSSLLDSYDTIKRNIEDLYGEERDKAQEKLMAVTSRLLQLGVKPDDIETRSKVAGLTDEEKTVFSDKDKELYQAIYNMLEKAAEHATASDLQKRIHAIDAKLKYTDDPKERLVLQHRREIFLAEMRKRDDFARKYHIVNGGTSLDDIVRLFGDLNMDSSLTPVFERVVNVCRMFSPEIKFTRALGSGVAGNTATDGIVKYNFNFFTNTGKSNQDKASTLIHELVHNATLYALEAYRLRDSDNPGRNGVSGKEMWGKLSSGQQKAVEEIYGIYGEIKSDRKAFPNERRKDGTQYGLKNVYEMVAEIYANSEFREQAKKKNLWTKLKEAVVRFFTGAEPGAKQTTVMKALSERIDYLLEHPNQEVYRDMKGHWSKRRSDVTDTKMDFDATRDKVAKRENELKQKYKDTPSQELFVSLKDKQGEEYNDTVSEIANRILSGRASLRGQDTLGGTETLTGAQAAGEIISGNQGRERSAIRKDEHAASAARVKQARAIDYPPSHNDFADKAYDSENSSNNHTPRADMHDILLSLQHEQEKRTENDTTPDKISDGLSGKELSGDSLRQRTGNRRGGAGSIRSFKENERREITRRARKLLGEKSAVSQIQREYRTLETKSLFLKVARALVGYRQSIAANNEANANAYAAIIEIANRELESRNENLSATNLDIPKGEVDRQTLFKKFKETVKDPDLNALFDKVANIVNQLGIKFYADDRIYQRNSSLAFGVQDLSDGRITLNRTVFNSEYVSDQGKMETLLHEMIHTATRYAFTIDSRKEIFANAGITLSEGMSEAIRQIKEIYNTIKDDPELYNTNGKKNIEEFLADMGKQDFRNRLKNIGLWQKLINGIKKFFGIEKQSSDKVNAYEKVDKLLNYILDNFDQDAYNDVTNIMRDVKGLQEKAFDSSGDTPMGENPQDALNHRIRRDGIFRTLGPEAYNALMRDIYMHTPDPDMRLYAAQGMWRNGLNLYQSVGDYFATEALRPGKAAIWQDYQARLNDALKKAGYDVEVGLRQAKYLAWLANHPSDPANPLKEAERVAAYRKIMSESIEQPVSDGEFQDFRKPSRKPASEERPVDSAVPPVREMTGEEASQRVQRDESQIRFASPGTTMPPTSTPTQHFAKQQYENALHSRTFIMKEAHVDYMQAAQEAVRAVTGKKGDLKGVLEEKEDFLNGENQLSSRCEAMGKLYRNAFMQPLEKAVRSILPEFGKNTGEAMRKLQLYMINKSGLERNRVLYMRDFVSTISDKKRAKQIAEDFKTRKDRLDNDIDKGLIRLDEYYARLDDVISNLTGSLFDASRHDYSGRTAVYGNGKDSYDDARAIREVMDVEDRIGRSSVVKELWDTTGAAAQFSVDLNHECGLIDAETRDSINKEFKWYVPMRGFDEQMAGDVYSYMSGDFNAKNDVAPTIQKAEGRTSLSNVDIFAQIGAMASKSISHAMRNQMVNQRLLNFVRDYYDVDGGKRLFTEVKHWVEMDADGNWHDSFPPLDRVTAYDANGNPVYDSIPDADVQKAVADWERDMALKEANGTAKVIKDNTTIPYRFIQPSHKSDHIVVAYQNGQKHIIVINGNPRAAQAINGQLSPARDKNLPTQITLAMSQLVTTYSPDFMVRNTVRDAFFAAMNNFTNEGVSYWRRYAGNYTRILTLDARHGSFFYRWRKGTLDINDTDQRLFKEFMENGGVTGWAGMEDVTKWQKEIERQVKSGSKEVLRSVFTLLPNALTAMNEHAENIARFATYMTSRKMGRSITRSVADAKNVSVNFNRKGAGQKSADFKNSSGKVSKTAILSAMTAQWLRSNIMFYNAGVQGLNTMAKNFKYHPVRASVSTAMFMAMGGFLIPALNRFLQSQDDDRKIKDPYAELPEYTRRQNICIYTGHDNFVTVPLPIELRAMYGIGDMIAGHTSDPGLNNGENVAYDALKMISQISPLDFLGENSTPTMALVPASVKPLIEAGLPSAIVGTNILSEGINIKWNGLPIRRDRNSWDKHSPAWQRAFASTGDTYVEMAKKIDKLTSDVNSENAKGLVDIDPAQLQHYVTSYTGGIGTTAGNLASLVKEVIEDPSIKTVLTSQHTPMLRTTHYAPTEQNRYYRTRSKWYKYKDEAVGMKAKIKAKKQEGVENPEEWIRAHSEELALQMERYEVMSDALKEYDNYSKLIKETDDNKLKDTYSLQRDMIMEKTVKDLDEIR